MRSTAILSFVFLLFTGTAHSQLVLNEIHADPATDLECVAFGAPIPASLCGDANGDGSLSSSEDEFIEIFNTDGSAVDLMNYTIEDGTGTKHTFAATTLNPLQAVVVFGGGTPTGSFGGAVVQTASSGGLALGNSGDSVTLKDDVGATVDSHSYGTEGGAGQSLTRSPDLSGSFSQHFTASGRQSVHSPGTALDGTVLPVELVSFEVRVDGEDVDLFWTTASETGNAGFDIEHGVDEVGFRRVGFVEGHFTTVNPHDYHFRVTALAPGVHRFRLKQVDLDGGFDYSSTLEVAMPLEGRFQLEPTYPNPVSSSATLRFAVAREQDVVAALYNVAGQKVAGLFSDLVEPNVMHELTISAERIPPGVYFVYLQGASAAGTETIVVVP